MSLDLVRPSVELNSGFTYLLVKLRRRKEQLHNKSTSTQDVIFICEVTFIPFSMLLWVVSGVISSLPEGALGHSLGTYQLLVIQEGATFSSKRMVF